MTGYAWRLGKAKEEAENTMTAVSTGKLKKDIGENQNIKITDVIDHIRKAIGYIKYSSQQLGDGKDMERLQEAYRCLNHVTVVHKDWIPDNATTALENAKLHLTHAKGVLEREKNGKKQQS